ncbi:Hypothetical predicted protein [Cloeon dipterum]|uniref:C2H2-type domain-containing protein n=1 Tax=Cloeon dipterum TaxID=197152 RepID=A0A8S1E733_9INSE|nr:Hypothetical predicted protein [Cloeon dipterum]
MLERNSLPVQSLTAKKHTLSFVFQFCSGALPLGNCTSRSLDPLASKANEAASPTKASALVKCHIPNCIKVYANKYSMLKHVKVDHILAKSSFYDCALCGSRFKTRNTIKDHWHTHLGLTPYRLVLS